MLSSQEEASPSSRQCLIAQAYEKNGRDLMPSFTILAHTPYSPDMELSDFYHFPKLKQLHTGNHYMLEDNQHMVELWFWHQDEPFIVTDL